MNIVLIILQIAAAVFAADFVAGLVHWFEDAYVREDTPVLGRVVARPNIIHHHLPRYFTRLNWWQSSWDLLCISGVLLLIAWFFGVLTWPVWLFAVVSTNANQIHKWAHETRAEKGWLVSLLHQTRLLQTPQHHALHHTNPKNSHYCTVTNWLNPALDGVHFWDGIEWILARTIGLRRREDTSLPGHGPAPAWLNVLRNQPSSEGAGRNGMRSRAEVGHVTAPLPIT
jgi:hypothetical protein